MKTHPILFFLIGVALHVGSFSVQAQQNSSVTDLSEPQFELESELDEEILEATEAELPSDATEKVNPSTSPSPASQQPIQSQKSDLKPPEPLLRSQTTSRRSMETNSVDYDPNLNRYPESQSQFVRPPGPKGGGQIKVPHPFAKKGLESIDAKNRYQYKVPKGKKTRAYSFRYGFFNNPKIESTGTNTFEDMYATSDNFNVFLGDYEFLPFDKKYGPIALVLGSGLATGQGQGRFNTPRPSRDSAGGSGSPIVNSDETFDFVIVPLTAQVNYRLEYFERQWAAPYLSLGFTYFGLGELQKGDNLDQMEFAGSASFTGGGGLNINISRWSSRSAFNMYSEWGVTDFWLTLDYKRIQSLKQDIDFSGNQVTLGITMDM